MKILSGLRSRRFLVVVFLFLFLLVGGAGALWVAIPKRGINPESFAKIRNGMTQAEVEAIFGMPAGNYASRHSIAISLVHRWERMPWSSTQEWVSDEFAYEVEFVDGRVVASAEMEVIATDGRPPTWFERIRRAFRL